MKPSASDEARRRRRRILICIPFAPRLDARHGGKATAQLLLRLAERHDVVLLCLLAPDDEGVDPRIARHCIHVEEVGRGRRRFPRLSWALWLLRAVPPWAADCRSDVYRRRLVQLLHEWRPDIVEIHFQAMAQYVTVPAKRGIPTILVDYDPASAWAKEMLIAGRGPRRIIRRLEVAAWRHNERGTRPIFDAIVVFAQRDVAEIERHREARAIVRIPLAVEVPLEALNPVGATPPTVLFVGGFAHPPNVDAALWLAEDIFPRVRENVREARLELVGHQPTDEIRALANNWVAVHGSVPDVLPYLDRAAVVVAPIRRGGSMRMKVLEALAGGKALVATPLAAEGVDAVSGEHYVLAAETDDLAASVAELLVDPERRRRLAENARSWAEQNLGWQNGVSAFEELYRRLSENGAAAP